MVIGILSGKHNEMMNNIMETPQQVYDLVLTLMLSACLWGGFLNIIDKSGFIELFDFIFKPLMKVIYGDIILNKHIYHSLSTNFLANLLGLGTLSTMSGINAFKNMYQYKNKVSKEMLTLVLINGSGLTLFPSSIIMLRKEMNSQSLYEFYPYMIIISIIILIVGLIIQRVIDHE